MTGAGLISFISHNVCALASVCTVTGDLLGIHQLEAFVAPTYHAVFYKRSSLSSRSDVGRDVRLRNLATENNSCVKTFGT